MPPQVPAPRVQDEDLPEVEAEELSEADSLADEEPEEISNEELQEADAAELEASSGPELPASALDPWFAQLAHGYCPPEGAQFTRHTPPTNFPGRDGDTDPARQPPAPRGKAS